MKKAHKTLRALLMTMLLCSLFVQTVFAESTDHPVNSSTSSESINQSGSVQLNTSSVDDRNPTSQSDNESQSPTEITDAANESTSITLEGETDDWYVKITADSGALPDGASLHVEKIEDTEDIENKAEDITGKKLKDITAADISFSDENGNEIEPGRPVQVQILDKSKADGKDPVIVHIDNKGTYEEKKNVSQDENGITFEADQFSAYVLAYTDTDSVKTEDGTEANTEATEGRPSAKVSATAAAVESSGNDVSSAFHTTITTENDTYESGVTGIVSVKYTIDSGVAKPGDYVIITIPDDIASNVEFSLNSQHFSGYESLGNGQYKLILSDQIVSGIAGSFSARVTFHTDNTSSTEPTSKTDTITAGDSSKTITVTSTPSGSGGGSECTDTIMKDGFDNGYDSNGNAIVQYGGYDYSEGYGNQSAQIGIADLTKGGTFKYRLYINGKKKSISNVAVIDDVPDGMTINSEKGVEVVDQATGKAISSSLYTVELTGQTLKFTFPGTFDYTIQINYWVDIPAGSNGAQYTNKAIITYTQDGKVIQEHRNYVLKGTDNNAANGEKSVDKSVISTDPDDQYVIYTIKFWNSNGFAAGEINLTDVLDAHVKFVNADPNEYFSIIQDSTDPQKILIKNTKAVDGSTTTYVRFMVDMTDVPVGYTVENTVGGNTTKTTKYDGGLSATAKKTINKTETPENGQFTFQLLSADGAVLQTKTNDSDGNITFDRISYTKDDVGQTYTYYVKEQAGDDTDFIYDESVYTVTVTPQLEYDDSGKATGKILAIPTYQKNSADVDSITFDNIRKVTSIKVTKEWNDNENQDGFRPDSVNVQLLANGEKKGDAVELSSDTNWSYTWNDLPVSDSAGGTISYTVEESDVPEHYEAKVEGDAGSGYTIINSHTPEKTTIQITKKWVDSGNRAKLRPDTEAFASKIHLMNGDSEVTGYSPTVTDNGDNTYTVSYSGMPKYADGKLIMYSVKEDAVDGYSQSAESVQNGETLTNTHLVDIDMPETGGWSGAAVLVIGSMLLAIGLGVYLLIRKRS